MLSVPRIKFTITKDAFCIMVKCICPCEWYSGRGIFFGRPWRVYILYCLYVVKWVFYEKRRLWRHSNIKLMSLHTFEPIYKWSGRVIMDRCNQNVSQEICTACDFTYILQDLSSAIGTTWWRHQMETFSALLAICAQNSPVTGEFPAQRAVTRSFDVFFDLSLNKRLSKQPWGWWFETPPRPLWHQLWTIL